MSLTWHAKRPETPKEGDAYFDQLTNQVMVFAEVERTVLDDIVAAVDGKDLKVFDWVVMAQGGPPGPTGPQGHCGPSGGPSGATGPHGLQGPVGPQAHIALAYPSLAAVWPPDHIKITSNLQHALPPTLP